MTLRYHIKSVEDTEYICITREKCTVFAEVQYRKKEKQLYHCHTCDSTGICGPVVILINLESATKILGKVSQLDCNDVI